MVLRTFAGYQTWQYEDAFRTGITRGVAPDPFQITADSWIPVQTAKGFAGMVDLFGMTDFSPEVVVPFAFLHPVIGAAQRGFLEVPDLLARTLFVEMVMGGTGSGTVWPFEVVFSEWMSYFQSSSTSADVHVPPLPVVKEVGIPPSQHFTTPALAAPLEIHQCPTTTPVQASPDAFQESTTPVDPGSSKVIVLPFARELRGLLKSSEASSHLEDLPGKPKNFSPTAVRHAALSGIFEREDCLADGFSKTSVFYEFSSEPMRRVQAEFADTMDEITDMAKQQEDPGTCRCVAHMERVPAVFNHRKSFRQSAQRGGVLFSSAFMGEQERTPVVSSSSSTSSPVPEWSFNPTSWSGSTSSPVPEWSFNPDPPVDVHSPVPTGAASAMDRSVPPELRVASSENGRWSFPQWVAMWKQITIPTLKKVQKKLCTQVYPYVKHQVEVEKRESSGWARLFERLNHRTVALCKAPEFDYLQRDDAEPVQVGGPRPGEARTTIVDWLSKEVKRSSLGSSGAGGATTEAGEVDDSEELELGAGGTGDFIHRVSI
ncbi:unnamed protein product [Amoebophrya sp. A25]|nr:unnamed protein product [Amoebophrya sp. A25]|eukprot:GSA25T00004130001.1